MPEHDVLIIGAGLAGQRAALAAADAGATVAIMSKVHPVRSHSVAAAGGINAAINPEDTWESHAYDTVKGSDFLGDQDAIEIMCREAPDEVMHLEHIGVTFHRNEKGELDLRAFGGASDDAHRLRRRHHRPGDPARALRAAHEAPRDASTATRSGSRPRCCRTRRAPASAASRATSARARWRSSTPRATILASGGAGQCFKPTTNALICTGDGIAQAYRIGAPLMDMEMIQYHPTTLAENGFLITEGARGEGAHLLNSQGERFMEKYAPNKMELASRDVVSRAEQTEINEGRGVGPDGAGIALDITVVPKKRTLEALREIVNIGKDFAGVDITARADPHPARAALHHGRRQDRRRRRRRRSRASTPPARSPASRSTAATASAPTRCWTR